ncbi:MAG: recombinase family protein [Lachnospiraceae bacterium]|nr:recombinase family protein [Lachnospiraceae bacterium]
MNWEIAIYLRLSKEDGDKEESDSIGSQRLLISNYIQQSIPDGRVVGEYVDDGCTGTNFNRPRFKDMICQADAGNINCIIVKDLSRFGREYIGVGEYLENYFPARNIRFVAINDGYDSIRVTSNDDFIMPIKNIFNAQYSKDISRKVKSSFRSLQSEGKFVGAFACYGYMKDPQDRHRLVVDEAAAPVVRRIFSLYNNGYGKISIARVLNDESIPCPSEYKRLSGLNYTNGQKMELTKYWTYSTVNTILHNEMYAGNMVQNKSIRRTVRGKAKKNELADWIKVAGTHEPVIDAGTWKMTQELLKRNTRQPDFRQNVGVFAGYIFCGSCGRAMTKIMNQYKSRTTTTYICGTYKRYGGGTCRRNAVKADFLEKLVLEKLNEQIKKIDTIRVPEAAKQNRQTADLKRYEISLGKNNRMKKSLYEDYREGILTKEEYLQYKSDYAKEEEFIKGQIEFITASLNNGDDEMNRWIETLIRYRNIEKLDREIVGEVLDKIIVTDKDDELSIDIIFKFKFL